MVDFEQYPDTLTYQGGTLKCRFVPSRENRTYKKQDGTEVLASYNIAFPLETPPLLLGTVISGVDRSGTYIVYEQELLRFHQGQLHNVGAV